jgi:hypothetical protein
VTSLLDFPTNRSREAIEMKKLLAAIVVGMFAVSSMSVIAAEKKEAAKVDCKDAKNKDKKECKKK